MQQSSRLSEVEAFIALATTGSFAQAGKLLQRDPTVLSRRVQALERRLSVRLALRTTRQVTLTQAGALYFDRVRSVLGDLDAADREVGALNDGEPSGHLRVALPGSFGRLWLAPILTSFLKIHPNVTLDASYSNQLVDLVGGGYDLAVRLAELPDSRLIARKVGARRRLVCASPDYLSRRPPITRPPDLSGHDCLCFTGRKTAFRWDFRHPTEGDCSTTVKCRIASDDADLLVEAALAGLGLFYTTDWHVGPLLAADRLVEVLPNYAVIDGGAIYVVMPAGAGSPPKTRALSDWIARGLSPPPWSVEALRSRS